jgi:hypothetical protein
MEIINSKIAGVFLYPAGKEPLKKLPPGGEIQFEREPSNPHDPNAIALFISNSEIHNQAGGSGDRVRIGYVPRDVAAFLAGRNVSAIAYGEKFGEIRISWNQEKAQ